MIRFRFSRRAQTDIEEIGSFIAKDSPARAQRYVEELRDRCRRLTAFPEAGPLRPAIGEGVRIAVFGRYLILYVICGNTLEIRRVVHGARDLADPDILN